MEWIVREEDISWGTVQKVAVSQLDSHKRLQYDKEFKAISSPR